jgi:hypothetical protein
MNARLTPNDIAERFEEAADTLKRLPMPDIQRRITRWPTIIRDAKEAYGYGDVRVRRGPPTAAAIDRMEEALTWLTWLEPDDLRLVWWRAERTRWKKICWAIGVSRTTAWQRWVAALMVVAARIDGRVGLPKSGSARALNMDTPQARSSKLSDARTS